MDAETNVRVPLAAEVALDAIAHRDGTSRAATLRRLLSDYVNTQSRLDEDRRLTHISTVLRYPLVRRGGVPMISDAVVTRQLRLRATPDLLANARTLGFRLPGQPPRRGHSDYQARPLTDAVMTSIAAEEPISDDVLDGLVPLVTHRAALELWHLAVEYTVTPAEREALAYSGDDARRRRTAELLVDDEEAWHHDRRVEVVRHFARKLLSGPEAFANAERLAAGRIEGSWLEDEALDLREITDPSRHELVADLPDGWNWNGREGRGGTAVWRAAHRAALEELPNWLRRRAGVPFEVDDRIGWELQSPAGWHAVDRFPATAPPPQPWAGHVETGGVLLLRDGRRHVLWPVSPSEVPIPRFGHVSHHPRVATLDPACVVELVLNPLLDVRLPRHRAVAWGLISEVESRAIAERASRALDHRIAATLEQARASLPSAWLAKLDAARRSYPEFLATCREHDVSLEDAYDTTWPWPVDCLADAIDDDTVPDAALAWLTERAVERWHRMTSQAQHEAWEHAFWRPDRHPR